MQACRHPLPVRGRPACVMRSWHRPGCSSAASFHHFQFNQGFAPQARMTVRAKSPASTRKLARLLVFALATCGSCGVLAQSSSIASTSSRVVSSSSSATTATATATARPAPEAPSEKTTTVQLPPLYACEYSTWTCVATTFDLFQVSTC